MSGTVPSPSETSFLRIVRSIRDLFEGRSNASGSFTVMDNDTTTTVTAINCSATSTIFLQATSANAAAEIGNGTLYVSAKAQGSFTVTHANNAQTDRTFDYRIGS